MMEEISDEQPEMVSHEEAVLAEREATQLSSPVAGGARIPPLSPQVAAPSPLPAFLTQKSQPTTPKSTTTAASATTPIPTTTAPSTGRVVDTEPKQHAPGVLEIPHEGKRLVEVPVSDPSPASNETSHSQGGASSSLFGWISGNSLVNKMVEKTKSSMESVITTLDPGMREVLYSGGDIKIAVTSCKDNKVIPVREAFQRVFGRATVTGKASESSTAAQPVGYTAGLKSAEERISNLRKSGALLDGEVVVSVEGFIVEILPDKWFEMSCLVLKDSGHGIDLQTFSQPTPIPTDFVMAAQDKTPSDYPLRWAGLAVTIGEAIESKHPHIGHADWQMVFSGVSRRESISLAAQALAHMYKEKLPTSFVS